MENLIDKIALDTQCQTHPQELTAKERAKMRYMAGCTRDEIESLIKTQRDWTLYALTFQPFLKVKGGNVRVLCVRAGF